MLKIPTYICVLIPLPLVPAQPFRTVDGLHSTVPLETNIKRLHYNLIERSYKRVES